MVIIQIVTALAAQPCRAPVTRTQLFETTEEAAAEFAALNWEALDATTLTAKSQLDCIEFLVRRPELARVFRLRGLALVHSQSPRAKEWFAASYGLQPGYVFDPPLRGPLRVAWEEGVERWNAHTSTVLPPPAQGELRTNGTIQDDIPDGIPWHLQITDEEGAVIRSALISPGEEMPSYPVRVVDSKAEDTANTARPAGPPTYEIASPSTHSSTGLAIAGGGMAVIGGVSIIGAQVIKQDYINGNGTASELKLTNYILGGGGIALATAGGILCTVAVINGEW